MKIKLHSQYDHFPNCQTDGDDFDLELWNDGKIWEYVQNYPNVNRGSALLIEIVPMSMEFDVSELLTIPTFKYTYNNTPLINKWKKLLGKTDPEYNYKPSNTNKVRVTKRYNDLTLNRYVNSGEVITVTPERAAILIKAGVARREAD